jgi:hypothetical protein
MDMEEKEIRMMLKGTRNAIAFKERIKMLLDEYVNEALHQDGLDYFAEQTPEELVEDFGLFITNHIDT